MLFDTNKETKSKLIKSIVNKLYDKLNINQQFVFIVIYSKQSDGW